MSQAELSPREQGINRRRSRGDAVLWGLCGFVLFLIVVPIVWIVGQVAARAIPKFSLSFLTQDTVGNGGGMEQAIVGTLVLMALVGCAAGFIGIASGVYLSEYAPRRLGGFLRGAIEILAGVPSIVVGYVIFVALDIHLHWGYSIWAAVIALSVIVVPYIARTTELALKGVPGSFRDGAAALGLRDTLVLRRILLKAAAPGIITGLIMALAISIGETAPLLYTAEWSVHAPTFSLHNSPVGYLTYLVWTFYQYPVKSATVLASEAAFFLIVMVGILIVAGRFLGRYLSRHMPIGQG